jgi:hypothetical protein
LTSGQAGLKYREFPVKPAPLSPSAREIHPGTMKPTPPSQASTAGKNTNPCKHPHVQIVAREEDEEFVECLECGEIFESSEFKDMGIEDNSQATES